MLGEEDDLPEVLGVMSDLTVNGLEHCMRLVTNRHDSHDVFGSELVDRAEDTCPPFFPPRHYFCASRCRADLKLAIADTVRFLAVASEKIREARAHVAGNVLDEDRD